MFHFLKGKNKENVLYAPCKGKVVPLSEVPDPTFSEKILGDGFAVIPSEGKIYAPTDGEIAMVFDTLHAMTRLNLSARAYGRILKVARTIALLHGRCESDSEK